MFDVDRDPHCPFLLDARVWGLWDVAETDRFERAVAACVARLPIAPGLHAVLIDMTDFMIQPQAVVERCAAIMATGLFGQRCALLVGNGLGRIQISRLPETVEIRRFDDRAAARRWLIAAPSHPSRPTAVRGLSRAVA